ncbi:Dabb family protein [Streptomyces tagetis]|uniref:Dabb family protein n=1 Tax=Streptomyces tagetis TaxID=2820809 RepID=A0A940XEN5_9ACTN|nr:Dabb family protein [Streptomyces sp. RG38]MBQ0825246.1 Dabb family protein [Streptomyces sp. RG38]
MLEHYVVFRPRPGKERELAEALAALESGLAGGLAGLAELSWGENTNRSGLDRGFTHGCLARFTGPEAFGRYWDHPAHERFLGVLDGICEDRFALDWTSGATA